MGPRYRLVPAQLASLATSNGDSHRSGGHEFHREHRFGSFGQWRRNLWAEARFRDRPIAAFRHRGRFQLGWQTGHRRCQSDGEHGAVANFSANTVSILFGSGTGTFARGDSAVGTQPVSVAASDFNLDTKPDLVVV